MTFPFGRPIVLRQRVKSGTDAFGNDTWTTTDTTVDGAFNPGTSAELVQGQDVVTIQPSVYVPAAVALAPTDAVVIDGQVYEVDGSPNRWSSPWTGWAPGVEIKLRRVTG